MARPKADKEDLDSMSDKSASQKQVLLNLLVTVCILVLVAHWPILSTRALFIDDQQYLSANSLVQNPSWASTQRFLTEVFEPSTVQGYYQPLTMISLMLDYALGGRVDNLQPFHRTSLALHVVNTASIIVLLYLLFGQVWVAAGVGLLFGLHPMTVEPISWIGERKTLLATFFALWCLIFYVCHMRKRDWKLYIGCMIMYMLAIMSKPTSIPLPMLMLVMDYWPLKHCKWRTVFEKLPLFVLGGIFAVITYVSQSRTAGVTLPNEHGIGHAWLILCHNIIFYLYKIIWPVNLSPHYAFPESFGLAHPMVLAGVIGTCILIPSLLISLRWTRAMLAGWLFFFFGILPAMGVVGFTIVIASDKFAYLPSIGLLMLLASAMIWFIRTENAGRSVVRQVTVVMVVFILGGSEVFATRQHLAHWRDTISLYKHALRGAPKATSLHVNLGNTYQMRGHFDNAISCYNKALQIKPNHAKGHYNMGHALKSKGKLDEAINHYRKALQTWPTFAKARYDLGNALTEQGKLDEAIVQYHKALEVKPNYTEAHNNLGYAYELQGRLQLAIDHYRRSVQIQPTFVRARNNLRSALDQLKGRYGEASNRY